jgi:uncharacterized membrane protein YcaP (DUF421 family)
MSKGLWEQLNNSNKREYVIHTGIDGLYNYNHALKINAAQVWLKATLEAKLITRKESVRLKEMLDSPDYENFEVVISILSTKNPTYVSHI